MKRVTDCAHRTLDALAGARDPIRLDTFRLAFGLSLLVYLAAWWPNAPEWLTPAGFHLSSLAAGEYGPVAPLLAPRTLPLFGGLLFGSVVAFILGWRLRSVTWLTLLLVTYVTYADPLAAFTLNRLFMAGLAVLAVGPKGSYWSVDPRPEKPQSIWPVRILQATVLTQYFTAGYCKMAHGDWLLNPHVLWTQTRGWYMTDLASWMLRTLPVGVFSWMQYGALTFELLSPVLFTWKRIRPVGFAWGFAFQIGTALIARQLIYFSLQMLCFYILFLDDEALHRGRRALLRLASRGAGAVRRRWNGYPSPPPAT